MALPTNVSYGIVTGRFLLAYADSSDVDPQPDGVPAKGFVIFTASPIKLLDASASPAPVTILPAAVLANLNSEGYIEGYTGDAGIRLVATDDTDLNPTGWTWRVDFRLTDEADVPVTLPSFSFQLPTDTTVDLTTVSPVPGADGTFYIIGPTGLTGATGATGTAATVAAGTTTTGAAGTDADVANSGTSAAAVFDFTIPRGDQGIQGIQGAQGEAATITVGSVTTGLPTDDASVTNVGTTEEAIFDFVIPQGETGSLDSLSATSPITYSSNTIGLDYDALVIDGGTA